jgi:hypothetical protein
MAPARKKKLRRVRDAACRPMSGPAFAGDAQRYPAIFNFFARSAQGDGENGAC